MPHGEMTTGRLEAFSDGVIAIIVTIMVLELRAPSQPNLAALWKVAPVFISYGLSFLVVAIMWVNHHHLIHAVHRVTARLLWTNMNLLFWMSLVPFVTDYPGEELSRANGGGALRLDLCCVAPRFICCGSLLRSIPEQPCWWNITAAFKEKMAFPFCCT